MADQFLILDGLRPEAALDVLAEVAGQGFGAYLRGMIIHATPDGRDVTLYWPDPIAQGQKKDPRAAKAYETARGRYRELAQREPRILGSAPRGAVPLAEGVAWILVLSSRSTESEARVDSDYLVVGLGMDIERAEETYRALDRLATDPQVMSARDDAGQLCWFFYVRNDPSRSPLFSEGLYPLTLFGFAASDRCRVFLPAGFQPGARALSAFSRLLQAAPELWGGRRQKQNEHSLLAALVPLSDADGGIRHYSIRYLLHLSLWDRVKLTPAAAELKFTVCRLVDTPHVMTELAERIEAADPHWGYRLQLCLTDHQPAATGEEERLEQQIIKLQDDLAYVRAMASPYPRLVRVSQAQLPALADLLTRYTPADIDSGLLQYAYQVTQVEMDRDPDEWHYLLIPPEAQGREINLDPLTLWLRRSTTTVRFWPDPYWFSKYGRAQPHLVFVPQGTALFPSLHTWLEGSMDGYLRQCLRRWFHGELNVAQIPAHPIYLFDGQAGPGAEIHISVLDRDAFVPLKTRLGWINDNLRVLHAEGLTKRYQARVEGMSRDAAANELATAIAVQAAASQAEFEATAHATSQRIADVTNELAQATTAEIDRLIADIRRTTDEIHTLNERLAALGREMRRVKWATTRAEGAQDGIERGIGQLEEQSSQLQQKVGKAIRDTEAARIQIERRVQAEIDRLNNTYQRLRGQL